jgi:general secretion pathway protein D
MKYLGGFLIGGLLRCAIGWISTAYAQEEQTAFAAQQSVVEQIILRGRAQYRYGDYQGAQESFKLAEAQDPDNPAAKYYQKKIAQVLNEQGYLDHEKTREQMLEEVNRSWQRPQVYSAEYMPEADQASSSLIEEKMRMIVLPRVSFSDMPLSHAVETLSDLSEEHDPDKEGVNIVLIDPKGSNPRVTLTLRNTPLDKVVDLVTQSVHYQYDVEGDAVVIRAAEGLHSCRLETGFFPISRATVIRLTGGALAKEGKGSLSPSTQEEEGALLDFFQRAGVIFNQGEGRCLAFDGTQLIVTQTPRNLIRLHNVLRRYQETKQVEIEAKFMEVQQGVLEELGFQWNVSHGNTSFQTQNTAGQTALRSLAQGFSSTNTSSGDGAITFSGGSSVPITNAPPATPNGINLGVGAPSLANILGVTDGWRVNVIINALEQRTGTDLMSAPKITVLSGKTAEIVVAQELPYPTSYGKIDSSVGTSSGTLTGGSAGVTITAGTPENFVVREVGVQMQVTPTVEDDNHSISLRLEPEVTEFEGFVEYGGTSIAISSGTTVNVPSGFFQPIFSVRKVRTEVTIYDGATVIMGGLTREQVKEVNDKVPILGDIPLLGRLFRSKGETSQKRNLLIFVTANLVSPGGSLGNQPLRSVVPGSLFQNPTVVTPGGVVSR